MKALRDVLFLMREDVFADYFQFLQRETGSWTLEYERKGYSISLVSLVSSASLQLCTCKHTD